MTVLWPFTAASFLTGVMLIMAHDWQSPVCTEQRDTTTGECQEGITFEDQLNGVRSSFINRSTVFLGKPGEVKVGWKMQLYSFCTAAVACRARQSY